MSKKVLVVDDDYRVTRLLSFLFEKNGYACEVGHDGEVAIEKIECEKPALIILDVKMPKKNGFS